MDENIEQGNWGIREFNLSSKIEEIEKALECRLYQSALSLALTIPDICGEVEFTDLKGSRHYIQWFDKYLGKYYPHIDSNMSEGQRGFNGSVCYALRCAFLHTGNDIFKEKWIRETIHCIFESRTGYSLHCQFKFTIGGYDGYTESRDLESKTEDFSIEVDIPNLCKHICAEAKLFMDKWEDKSVFNFHSISVFDTYKWHEDAFEFYSNV